MTKICVEDMLSGRQSKYSLVMAVAKRARQITDENDSEGLIPEEKAVNMAIKDFSAGRYIVLRPDAEDKKC